MARRVQKAIGTCRYRASGKRITQVLRSESNLGRARDCTEGSVQSTLSMRGSERCMMRGMSSPRRESDLMDMQTLVDSIPALIHTARPDGYLDYFNKRWLEYLGVTLDKVAGWNWTAFIHPEDVEGIVAKWRACLATREVFEYETRVRSANGEYRWMFYQNVPL